jgi:multidrug resistance efflux pump
VAWRALGLGFLALASVVLVPSFWSITSNRAVVNAPVVGVHAPIEGIVTPKAMAVGQAVRAGQILLRIDNGLLDQGPLEKLRTEEVVLSERIAALRDYHAALGLLKADLAASVEAYQAATLLRLEQEMAAAQHAAASAEAVSKLRAYEDTLSTRLASTKSISQQDGIAARHKVEESLHSAGQGKAVVQRLEVELAAARKGVYVGAGDGRADVPYSKQRLHEVLIRQAELKSSIQELSARLGATKRELSREEQRVQQQGSQEVRAPSDGIVWRRHVNTGTRVAGPAPVLLDLVNPDEIFIDALVTERYAGFIRVGDKVRIKFIGSDEAAGGVVKQILGRSGSWDHRLLAAEVLPADKREVHVIVTFEDAGHGTDLEQYRLGHPVEIAFGNQMGFLRYLLARTLP